MRLASDATLEVRNASTAARFTSESIWAHPRAEGSTTARARRSTVELRHYLAVV